MSKAGKPRKAPKISAPSKKKPNFMRENDNKIKRKSPQQPMKSKRLSK
jgi:hypothetical protein